MKTIPYVHSLCKVCHSSHWEVDIVSLPWILAGLINGFDQWDVANMLLWEIQSLRLKMPWNFCLANYFRVWYNSKEVYSVRNKGLSKARYPGWVQKTSHKVLTVLNECICVHYINRLKPYFSSK